MFSRGSARLPVMLCSLGILMQASAVCAQSYGSSPGAYTNNPGPGPQTTVYVPQGMTLNARLNTAISTDVAQPGDLVQATLNEPVMLGNATLPSGTVLYGSVSEAKSGGMFGRSGKLTVKFDRMRTPTGVEAPMASHIVGNFGKYESNGQTYAGETIKTKAGQAAIRTVAGAGVGAALGTAVGAIAGRGTRTSMQPVYAYGHGMVPMQVGYQQVSTGGAGRGAGRGAWSGAAIGGGVGLADSLILRQGKQVVIPTGTNFQIQLDAPITLTRPNYGYM